MFSHIYLYSVFGQIKLYQIVIGSGNGLAGHKQQAITCYNINPDLC